MLIRRMPPVTERRNRAYLNRGKDRAWRPEREFLGLAGAAGPKRVRCGWAMRPSKDLCALTVELSGARAVVGAWHLMLNASARTRC